jgi:hypothetical protein
VPKVKRLAAGALSSSSRRGVAFRFRSSSEYRRLEASRWFSVRIDATPNIETFVCLLWNDQSITQNYLHEKTKRKDCRAGRRGKSLGDSWVEIKRPYREAYGRILPSLVRTPREIEIWFYAADRGGRFASRGKGSVIGDW